MTDVVKDFYDNKSLHWDVKQKWFLWWLFYKFEKFTTQRNDKVFELIQKITKKRKIESVCDIWCGCGLLLQKINKSIPNLNYISGIDIYENALKKARLNIKNGDFYCCDINNPFELHKKCDLITCIAIIEHVFDPESVVKNISQNINDGGTLIIQVPNIVCITRRISFLFWNRPRTSWDAWRDWWHISYFTKKDVVKLFKDNWFKIEKITWSWVFAPLRNRGVSMLSPDIICVWVKKR